MKVLLDENFPLALFRALTADGESVRARPAQESEARASIRVDGRRLPLAWEVKLEDLTAQALGHDATLASSGLSQP